MDMNEIPFPKTKIFWISKFTKENTHYFVLLPQAEQQVISVD